MDPLSVAASVAGLVAAATSITKTLSALSEPPRLIRSVAAETSALSAIFAQLNGILRSNNNSHTRRERMSMTTVEQFVAILTHCVLTFSELEQEMDGLGVGNTLWDRVKWNSKTDIVREILADLQAQKVSLGLMIGIWSW